MTRTYDIILLGATGFTGTLIARYLIERTRGAELKIALAGRSEEKGKALLSVFAEPNLPWVTVDVFDETGLREALSRTKIVMNAAGPFAEYGPPVVKACVKAGTHYLDITGEPSFYNSMKSSYHTAAVEKGVSIIHACGFDSIPADLGALALVDLFKEKKKISIQAFIHTNAEFSGGTWTTAIKALIRQRKGGGKTRRPRRENDNVVRIPVKIHYQNELKRWAVPMPVLDPHIVKSSARSMPNYYGQAFGYAQFFTVGSFWKMVQLIFGISMLFFLSRFKWGQQYLFGKNKPGTGPNEERRARSKFSIYLFGKNLSEAHQVTISGGDPGYNETAKMLSEAALLQLEKSDQNIHVPGVVTPAVALGLPLLERLEDRGFKVTSS